MPTTTNLVVLRRHPNRFTWGRILNIHDVGNRYTIVEFAANKTRAEDADSDIIEFHVYVDDRDAGRSSKSFEGALLIAIAIGRFGLDSPAEEMARAAAKLLLT